MDITIKGIAYRTGRINAITQLHLVRRMAPVTAGLAELVKAYDAEQPLEILEPLGRAVAALPDADVDYIVNACLDAVSVRREGGGHVPVRSNGVLMFELELATLLLLSAQVIRENLSSFFSEIGSLLSSAAPQTPPASHG